jgi:site-specific recombinase XerC
MARYSEGWRLRLPKGRTVYVVRFTVNGRTVDRTTGSEDPREAAKAAARVYADFIQREPLKRRVVRRGGSYSLEELVAIWLESDSTIDPDTVKTWTVYGGHWSARWEAVVDVTEPTAETYRNERLRVVQAGTVRKELSALRRFLRWCVQHGHLGRAPTIPGVPSSATGTRFAKRRRGSAPELSPRQVEAIIARLPEWSNSKRVPRFPIRARFIVGYETGLRSGALDLLSTPEHYHPKAPSLTVTAEIDKARWGRELPLSARARKALDAVCPESGLIFGRHDYREHIAAAAAKALPPAQAAKFCAPHFRSAMITHRLEATGNLPGVQYLAGHKQAKTTGGYVRPSYRAAEEALRGRSPNFGDARSRRRA